MVAAVKAILISYDVVPVIAAILTLVDATGNLEVVAAVTLL
ncbi:hypothetical protein ACIQYG_18670 [Peribacillus sp. NPDC096622]